MRRSTWLVFGATLLLFAFPLRAQSHRYELLLEDPPVAARIASHNELRSPAALDANAKIEAAQQTLRRQLAGRQIRVTGSAKLLLNALFVEASDARQLQGLAGVRRVAPLRPMHRHLDHALPLVNAPQAWTALAGAGLANPGAGIKIAILDSGIDQTHPGFQDSSLTPPASAPACNDKPGQPGNNDCGYTNSKVIVARSYVGMLAADSGYPDDTSPRDRVGHGTAAAMMAAGVQHQAPLAVISGVALRAYLGNYKIFGSPGVNDGTYADVLTAALEDAYTDGMDIVNLSMGAPAWYGGEDMGATCDESPRSPCDVEAISVENAILSGLMVVVSAGNDGTTGIVSPTLNTINSPGTAPDALTVGASRNSHELYSKVGLTAQGAPGNLANMQASFGDGPKLGVTAPLVDVASLGNDGLACVALPASSLNGAIALVLRDPTQCDFWTKVTNAEAAGAVGVVIYLNAAGAPFPPLGLAGTGIPAVIVGMTDGQNLKSYLAANAGAQVAMDPTLAAYNDPTFDTVADFSSRGPSIGDNGIKPEVVAPGTGIYTATQRYDTNGEIYSSTGYTVAEGTSMSAALVSGALALVKQKTGWPAAQLKSAVVNTATTGIQDGGAPASLAAVGAGKLNVQAAVQTNVTVVPSTVSFPPIKGIGDMALFLTVYNGSNSALTLSVAEPVQGPSLPLILNPTTIPAGQARTGVGVSLSNVGLAHGSYEGVISITGGAVPVHVPYRYLVSDSVLYNLFPIANGDFLGVVNQQVPGEAIALRALDQYGIPVVGAPVVWTGTVGGTTIDTIEFNATTALYGVAVAWAYLGPNPGDQEFTATVGSGQPLVLPFLGRARLQPTINAGGVINAASQLAPATGQGLAPGSYISIWGQNLAESNVYFADVLAPGIDPYLPVALAGVHVGFSVPGQLVSVPGGLTYASAQQINAQIPWELQGYSTAWMTVSIGGIDTAVYTFPLASSGPALFEYPVGSGNALAQDPFAPTWFSTSQQPVRAGQWVTFYANGLGPVSQTPASGQMTPPASQGLAQCTQTITVSIAGQSVTPEFAGLTPTGIGYYQINVQVPANAPSGIQPVIVTANGVAAKTVYLAIQ
ncbi:MAG: S8 family serine peptidase [Bryobacteraceae bacterium]